MPSNISIDQFKDILHGLCGLHSMWQLSPWGLHQLQGGKLTPEPHPADILRQPDYPICWGAACTCFKYNHTTSRAA